jgi:hypothetical protein
MNLLFVIIISQSAIGVTLTKLQTLYLNKTTKVTDAGLDRHFPDGI